MLAHFLDRREEFGISFGAGRGRRGVLRKQMSFDSLRSLRMTRGGGAKQMSFDSLRSLRMTRGGGGKGGSAQGSVRGDVAVGLAQDDKAGVGGRAKQMSFDSLRSLRMTRAGGRLGGSADGGVRATAGEGAGATGGGQNKCPSTRCARSG